MTSVFDVIRKPLLTEKNQGLRDKNIQVFEVAAWANKHQIQEAVELLLQAKVKKFVPLIFPYKPNDSVVLSASPANAKSLCRTC